MSILSTHHGVSHMKHSCPNEGIQRGTSTLHKVCVGLTECPHGGFSSPVLPRHHHARHQCSLMHPLASSISRFLKVSAAPLLVVTGFDVTSCCPAWVWDTLGGSCPSGTAPHFWSALGSTLGQSRLPASSPSISLEGYRSV